MDVSNEYNDSSSKSSSSPSYQTFGVINGPKLQTKGSTEHAVDKGFNVTRIGHATFYKNIRAIIALFSIDLGAKLIAHPNHCPTCMTSTIKWKTTCTYILTATVVNPTALI